MNYNEPFSQDSFDEENINEDAATIAIGITCAAFASLLASMAVYSIGNSIHSKSVLKKVLNNYEKKYPNVTPFKKLTRKVYTVKKEDRARGNDITNKYIQRFGKSIYGSKIIMYEDDGQDVIGYLVESKNMIVPAYKGVLFSHKHQTSIILGKKFTKHLEYYILNVYLKLHIQTHDFDKWISEELKSMNSDNTEGKILETKFNNIVDAKLIIYEREASGEITTEEANALLNKVAVIEVNQINESVDDFIFVTENFVEQHSSALKAAALTAAGITACGATIACIAKIRSNNQIKQNIGASKELTRIQKGIQDTSAELKKSSGELRAIISQYEHELSYNDNMARIYGRPVNMDYDGESGKYNAYPNVQFNPRKARDHEDAARRANELSKKYTAKYAEVRAQIAKLKKLQKELRMVAKKVGSDAEIEALSEKLDKIMASAGMY